MNVSEIQPDECLCYEVEYGHQPGCPLAHPRRQEEESDRYWAQMDRDLEDIRRSRQRILGR